MSSDTVKSLIVSRPHTVLGQRGRHSLVPHVWNNDYSGNVVCIAVPPVRIVPDSRHVAEPLKDVALFAQAAVHPECETVVWPNGADLAPEFLYEAAKQSSKATALR